MDGSDYLSNQVFSDGSVEDLILALCNPRSQQSGLGYIGQALCSTPFLSVEGDMFHHLAGCGRGPEIGWRADQA